MDAHTRRRRVRFRAPALRTILRQTLTNTKLQEGCTNSPVNRFSNQAIPSWLPSAVWQGGMVRAGTSSFSSLRRVQVPAEGQTASKKQVMDPHTKERGKRGF